MTAAQTILWLFQNFELATTNEICIVSGYDRETLTQTVGADRSKDRDSRELRERKKNPLVNPSQVFLMRKRLQERRKAAA